MRAMTGFRRGPWGRLPGQRSLTTIQEAGR